MNNTRIKASSDYAFNYTEHLVKKELDSKLIMARVGIILLSFALFGLVLFLMFGPIKIPSIAVVAVVLIIYLAMVLWSFTNIEYEYLIVSGTMSVDKIISTKKRRQIVEFNVPSAEKILPYKDAKLDGIDVIYGVSSLNAEDAYCAIFTTEKGEKKALVFNATKKALDMLRYYNKNCVMSDSIK